MARNLSVTLSANVNAYVVAMMKAGDATTRAMDQAEKAVSKQESSWQRSAANAAKAAAAQKAAASAISAAAARAAAAQKAAAVAADNAANRAVASAAQRAHAEAEAAAAAKKTVVSLKDVAKAIAEAKTASARVSGGGKGGLAQLDDAALGVSKRFALITSSAGRVGASIGRGAVAGVASLGRLAVAAGKTAASVAKLAGPTNLGRIATGAEEKRSSLNDLARTSAVIGAALLAIPIQAVSAAAGFDAAMSRVAATGAGAAGSITSLRDQALLMGRTTVFSATEAAGGLEALAKAGVSADKVIHGGLVGTLNLAAAGGLDVETASEIAAAALGQFGDKAGGVVHVADLLTAGANKAQGTVQQLGFALKYAGPVAAGMGVSIEETVGVLGEFANAGILGEQAGTSLRGILVSLTSPSKVAAKQMDQLGISLYDNDKKFVGLAGVADQLHNSLVGETEATRNAALGHIFGNAQITAARILYEGAGGAVRDWTQRVNDAGIAQETARARLDNLQGDLLRLKNTFNEALIGAGEGAQSPLRGLVQDLTGVVALLDKIPEGAKSGILSALAGLGGLALGVATLTKLVVTAGEAKEALRVLGVSGRTAGLALGGIGLALGIAAVVIANYAQEAANAKAAQDGFNEALAGQAKAINPQTTAFAIKQLSTPPDQSGWSKFWDGTSKSALEAADSQGIAQDTLVDAALGNATAQGKVRDAMAGVERQIDALRIGYNSNGQAIYSDNAAVQDLQKTYKALDDGVFNTSAAFKAAVRQHNLTEAAEKKVAGTTGQLTDEQQKLAKAYVQTGVALDALAYPAKRTAEQNQEIASSLFEEGKATQNVIASHAGFAAAVDDSNKTLKANGDILKYTKKATEDGTKALTDGKAKQRESISALTALADAGKGYVESLVLQGKGAKRAAAATKDVRDEFVKAAKEAGLSGKAAGALADDLGLIPENINIKFDMFNLALQQAQVAEFTTALQGLPEEERLRILAIYNDKGAKAAQREFDHLTKVKAEPQILTKSDAAKVSKSAAKLLKAIPDGKPSVKATDKTSAKIARQSQAFLDSIKDVDPKVLTKKDLAAAKAAATYLANMDDRTLYVKTVSDLSGARSVVQYLGGIHDKTVTVRTQRKDGTSSSVKLAPATGGFISGPGTATSDSIPAMLSNGEYVIRAAAVAALGLEKLHALNSLGAGAATRRPPLALRAAGGLIGAVQHFATGGAVAGSAGFKWPGMPGGFDLSAVVKLIQALRTPIADLQTETTKVAKAQRAYDATRKANTKQRVPYEKADAAYDAAVAKRDKARAINNAQADAARARVAKASGAKAIAAARAHLAEVTRLNTAENNRLSAGVTKLSKVRSKAKVAYDKVNQKEKDANAALKTSQEALLAVQQRVADSARATADSFRDAYTSQTTDVQDWIALMKDGATDIGGFLANIAKLRSTGLNETLIQQIIGMGAIAGNDAASQILAGGKQLADTLNQANAGLQGAADKLGYFAATGTGRIKGNATGGYITGPGSGTSDSIAARLSNGEYVVNAASTAAHRVLLDSINYGRKVIDHRPVQFRYGGPVVTQPQVQPVGDTFNFNGPITPDPWAIAGAVQRRKRNALAVTGAGRRI